MLRASAFIALLMVWLVGCAAPGQNGGVIMVPGATQRMLLAMRLGWVGAGEARPPARVRRVLSRDDLPTGPGASGRIGDWLLETGTLTAVIAAVDRSPRGGHLVDVSRRRGERLDELGVVAAVIGERPVRYFSLATGTDDTSGTAWVQVTGRFEGGGATEVVTRYDVAPDLAGVVMHTSLKLSNELLGGPIAVGDTLTFPAASTRIQTGPVDVAAFGARVGYLLMPLTDPPLVVRSAPGGASIGLGPDTVMAPPDEPFIYSRVLALLERPDGVALAAARASTTGQPLGEVEIELVPLPRKPGTIVDSGRFLLRRDGPLGAMLELPVTEALHPGDRRHVKVPAGRYVVAFEGGGYRSVTPATILVAPKVISPVKIEARLALASAPSAEAEQLPPTNDAPEAPPE